jgi:hypothetical protein
VTSGWAREFEDPIILSDGRTPRTLLDAGNYIQALSRKDQSAADWHNAVEVPLLVAEKEGPTMFARIGVMKARSTGTSSACSILIGKNTRGANGS